ncbi:hypothetical protein Ae168Ps1_6147 [Pseudonocardia sp. Ae168_Ps1]|nr:hypothetical protein Ae150APs1_6081 [Pseudonocardia sp. Ae150A_Ps1]OLL70550.1 hypothetical protein Ae263Ps1_6300 [Pseudonocardia sp. Ae263_Ps1]OLL70682.1 hypothetical protein Ae168Ps1_6147 [Pseudonocardia sp. Ae168_Ps1]OLL89221.1 hypothetical protein Ae356Ps1_6140c [Pseudonocardia sp. Ae356_Ps1]
MNTEPENDSPNPAKPAATTDTVKEIGPAATEHDRPRNHREARGVHPHDPQ